MTKSVTVFTTTTCGPCRRLKRELEDSQIEYLEVNLELDDEAAEWVMRVNAGDRAVPTVKFADESTLTNPSIDAVRAKLAQLSPSPG